MTTLRSQRALRLTVTASYSRAALLLRASALDHELDGDENEVRRPCTSLSQFTLAERWIRCRVQQSSFRYARSHDGLQDKRRAMSHELRFMTNGQGARSVHAFSQYHD